ncbi:MAG: TatD family hydrolase [Bacteroidetes bacterium]|nr:TatD family hydrolase [Bacteroidota bacterium]MCY4232338.1 TatD family hydrolase [Bacteroidota bacterium]
MLIDTHAHLYDKRFENDLDDVMIRANEAGINQIFLPAVDVSSVYKALNLAANYEGVYAMAGIHPTHVKEATNHDIEEITRLCDESSIIAVGEAGLDYYWDKYYDDRQLDFFVHHIHLASKKNLPLIIHLRDKQDRDQAHQDAVEILRKELPPNRGSHRGIFHCFTGPKWLPEVAAQLGFLIGVGGAVTFKNSSVANMILDVPLSQIVLETDAPYMSPVPFRGKRNEPAWITHVAQKIAEIKKITVAEVAEITSTNARQLFGLS